MGLGGARAAGRDVIALVAGFKASGAPAGYPQDQLPLLLDRTLSPPRAACCIVSYDPYDGYERLHRLKHGSCVEKTVPCAALRRRRGTAALPLP